MAFNSYRSVGSDDKTSTGLDNEYTVDYKKLLERIDTLETTAHAMWLMLKNRGYTDEEFDVAMAEADAMRSEKFSVKGLRCPNCGKSAQLSKTYKIKCIYCGSDAIIHPYEIYEIVKQQEAAELAQAEAQAAEIPQAYDVTQDLRFDEL